MSRALQWIRSFRVAPISAFRSIGAVAPLAAACIALAPALSHAQAVVKFATTIPPTHPMVAEFFNGWAKKLTDASGGEMQVQVATGPVLANAQNVWERTVNGVTEIGFGIHGAVGLPFPKTTVVSLPFLVEDLASGSVALWRMYVNGLIADEHKDVKVLALVTFPVQGFHSRKPIATLADIKGLKVRAADRIVGDIITALGGSPISVPAPETYQALNQGVVGATMGGWTLVQGFKLQELAGEHLEGALGAPSGFIVMNKQAYEKLSPKAKQAIDKFSGESLSREFGEWLQFNEARSRDQIKALPNQNTRSLSPQEAENWRQALAVVNRQWMDRTPGGDKMLAAYRAELDKLRSK